MIFPDALMEPADDKPATMGPAVPVRDRSLDDRTKHFHVQRRRVGMPANDNLMRSRQATAPRTIPSQATGLQQPGNRNAKLIIR